MILDFEVYVSWDVRLIRAKRLEPFDAGLLVRAVDEKLDGAESVFARSAVDVELDGRLIVWVDQL